MAEGVELIPFLQPEGEERTLYVTGIPASLPCEDKWHMLWETFIKFGLLYDVHLPMQTHTEAPSASVASLLGSSATEYAFVKFYSSRAASTAQQEAEKKGISMSGKILRVKFASRTAAPVHPPPPLYIRKCQELANYYLGFNGWSVRVVSLDDIGPIPGTHVVRFRCVAALQVKGCEAESVGVGEGNLEMEDATPLQRVQAVGTAKKLAFHRACEKAFSKVVITVPPSGKVGVQILRDAGEYADSLLQSLMDGCPPVQYRPEQEEQANDSTSHTQNPQRKC